MKSEMLGPEGFDCVLGYTLNTQIESFRRNRFLVVLDQWLSWYEEARIRYGRVSAFDRTRWDCIRDNWRVTFPACGGHSVKL